MNQKTIETLSVNAVRNSIVLSDYLDQYIPDNDKEPFWDGAVYIYKNSDHKKSNFTGRQPVQVKGKQCNNLSKKEISYPVSITDLKGFLNDGGVLFFVVYVSSDGQKNKIYYLELTPIRIRFILNSAKSQQSKNLTFKEFPTDNDQKATIVMNCFANCERQHSFANAKLYTIEKLQSQGVLESLSMHLSGIKINDDPEMAFINNDVYIYANVKGSTIPQPIEMLPQNLHTTETIEESVTIDGKEYYSEIKIVKNSTSVTFVIGESFKITQNIETKKINYSYTTSDKLQVVAKDLDFMLAYIDAGYLELFGKKFPFEKKNANFSNFNIEEQRKNLEVIKRTTQVLDELGCKKPLLISSLSACDNMNLSLLNIAFIDKKPVEGLLENIPTLNRISLGNVNLLLLFIPKEDKPTTYSIKDFFATEILIQYKNKNGKDLPISQFSLLTYDDLIKADNLKCDAFLLSFQKAEKHEETFERANWLLLDLLCAYDKSQKFELLNTAKDFAEWILTSTEEEMPYNIKKLNHLQVLKRLRPLTQEEMQVLYNIIGDNNSSNSILVGAYLLLDQPMPARIYFNKLSIDEQKEFKTYPIYHFWKETEDKNGQA